MTCASCMNRISAVGSAAADGMSSLMATSRPRPICSARETAPIPPLPSSLLIRYLPICRAPVGGVLDPGGAAAGGAAAGGAVAGGAVTGGAAAGGGIAAGGGGGGGGGGVSRTWGP